MFPTNINKHALSSHILEYKTAVTTRKEPPKQLDLPTNNLQKKPDLKEIISASPTKLRHKPITDDKELLKEFKRYKEPFVWDVLQPTPGVALKQGGKLKQGPSFSEAEMLSTTTKSMRVSKLHYDDKIKSGAIHRDEERSSSVSQLRVPQFDPKISLPSSNRQNNSLHKKSSSFLPAIDSLEHKPEIKVHSSRLMAALTMQNDNMSLATEYASGSLTDRQLASTKSVYAGETKVFEDMSLKLSKLDEFNANIMRTNDWGKQANVYNMNQAPLSFPKFGHSKSKPSLGFKLKLPRERDFKQTLTSPIMSMRESKTKDFF